MKQKILFVEDQEDLGNVVKQYLEIMNFEVLWRTNGAKAFETFQTAPSGFDILIIDIQLPGMDGFNLAEKVVKINDSVPFLFLTARNEKKDRIHGLKIGADDYISKPFDIDELVLRIKNIIRRNHINNASAESLAEVISAGDLKLYKELLKLSVGNREQTSLTQREAELLEYLCKHPNRVLKREDILLQLWGENDYFLGRSLDVFISRLRKLLSASKSVSIDNVYGIGFIFHVKQ
ncbi:two-component system response regulator [Arachidicoccus ginsenosidimutans]|uniref:response regulator transcription factor n=1 Tax=Arachidicoccus sp. BS20 TaxID=1850526 RepID=UPI0007F0AF04|nr:response regulator transcription factor [Arachidicoccus sp. BS20]ANI90072.1 two-component system response regulator [Arachidicoccus sp. BS20]